MLSRIHCLLGRISFGILLLGIALSSRSIPAIAQSSVKTAIDANQIIKNAFYDVSIYHPLGCAGNVGRLLEKLSFVLDISKLKVMFLLYENGYSAGIPLKLKLKPYSVREYIAVWNYHAVILSQNYIVDLHSKPFPLSARNYFAQHFPEGPGTERWKKIMVQIFPADKYLSAFLELQKKAPLEIDHTIGAAYLNRPSTAESPILSVADLLKFYK